MQRHENKSEYESSPYFQYNQMALRAKINTYSTLQKKSLLTHEGDCYGLAVLWLKRNFQNCPHVFYNSVKKIIDCPDAMLMTISAEIESFYMDVSIAQRGETQGQAASVIKEISIAMSNVEFDAEEFLDFMRANLSSHAGMIIGNYASKHALAIYRRNSIYTFFDANSIGTELHQCSLEKLFPILSNNFYGAIGMNPPNKLPFVFEILKPRPRLLADYPRPLFFKNTLSAVPSISLPVPGVGLEFK